MSATQNGVTPRKTVPVETSGTTPLSTKTLSPTGGVMRLISVTTTTMMPNHTGSYPRPTTSGKKIGTVRSSMDSDSNTQPSRR